MSVSALTEPTQHTVPLLTIPYSKPFIHTSCSIDKSYLVDVVTKLYIATDSNPVDVRTYELCSDLVDVRTSSTVRTCVVCVKII